jgi:hypothetical protein
MGVALAEENFDVPADLVVHANVHVETDRHDADQRKADGELEERPTGVDEATDDGGSFLALAMANEFWIVTRMRRALAEAARRLSAPLAPGSSSRGPGTTARRTSTTRNNICAN